ncbi:MAG: bifunctional 4'-phosphopantothenoylcysteine decarboxylase/phosphopantothenoylcysteine synthetase, partial [Actinobacteria bacterium]|nr:bifunctional 4'-phosphopantothenoylcysteine decarboxylase/phosphopantothenoylcysteine synthetase [Actinomycetota bacterium]
AAKRPGQVLVGFAAETADVVEQARAKLAAKHLDLVVANDVSAPDAGFEVDTNRVILIESSGIEEVPLLPKAEVAARILDRVVALRAGA